MYNKCGHILACGQLLPIFVFAWPMHKVKEEEVAAAAATVERVQLEAAAHFGSR